jgi:hypothetical protein
MTPSNDLDRRLTDFLADGPSSATERSIVFALDHAAAHPRRRDALAVLRRDPMRSPTITGPMRVLPLAAALALLVLALAAVAFVGGAFNQQPVVPAPIVSPSPAAPSPTPPRASTIPSAAIPSATGLPRRPGRASRRGRVDGHHRSFRRSRRGVVSRCRRRRLGRGGQDRGAGPGRRPGALAVLWTGMPCDTTHTLDIAPDHTLTITRPSCSGDTLPVGRVVILRFKAPIDPASVHGSVVTTGG